MGIIQTNISKNITQNDNKLSFKLGNNAEYLMNITDDKYLIGKDKPVAYTTYPPDNVISAGYKAKIVFTENITVELYKDADNSPFYKKDIVVKYYIQTKDSSYNNTVNGDTGTGGSDTGSNDTGGSGGSGTGDGGTGGSGGTGGTGNGDKNISFDTGSIDVFGKDDNSFQIK